MSDFYYFWITIIISVLLITYGFFAGRNKPDQIRDIYRKKYVMIALIPLVFGFIFLKPHISSYSRAEYLDDLKTDNLNSVEEIASSAKEQARQITFLKTEATRLREDLTELNDFVGFLFTFFYSVIIGVCISLISNKRKINLPGK